MKTGTCRLCHKYGELTYEHVPPKIAYNRNTRYRSIPFLDYVTADQLSNVSFNSKINQGGIGFYSLCSKCNSWLGQHYVNAYHHFAKIAGYIVKRNENNYFSVEIKELEPLKILKQICSMFLTINDEVFSKSNEPLVKFVSDSSSQELPDKYRIFIYLNSEGHFRYLPLMAKGNFNTTTPILCSEITFPPLGLVMTIDYFGSLPLTEITNFKAFAITQEAKLSLEFFKLPTWSPFALDYRDHAAMDSHEALSVPNCA